MTRTYIDLFAGCGGLSLGLHKAGWNGMFAIERDAMAFETLEHNMLRPGSPYINFADWPDWLQKQHHSIDDILNDNDAQAELIALQGKITLIAGGPPCQGFSVGGIRDGQDLRNQLVHRMLEIVDLVKPTMVLIENVEGIARRFVSKPGANKEAAADNIVQCLNDKGYDAAYTIVDASRFGVPQVRRRVIILGISKAVTQGRSIADQLANAMEHAREQLMIRLELPLDRRVTVGEALQDLSGVERVVCPDSPKFSAGTYTNAQSTYARLMRHGTDNSQIPDSHRFSNHGEGIRNLYTLAHQTQSPGRLSKDFLLSCGTKKDKKVLLDPDKPASTITTHPDEFIHYTEPRNITVREMARLQSFPDDFHFRGRYTINGPRRRYDVARCSQVGNAVPPLLAEALGLALHELLNVALGLESSLVLSDELDLTQQYLQRDIFEIA